MRESLDEASSVQPERPYRPDRARAFGCGHPQRRAGIHWAVGLLY